MGWGSIYSNQVLTGVNPKNPKILGCDRSGTYHLVGASARICRARQDVKERNELKLYSELTSSMEDCEGKTDKCGKSLFVVE
jgi:hypothetical protein